MKALVTEKHSVHFNSYLNLVFNLIDDILDNTLADIFSSREELG